jgi:hypothetical protein
MKRWILVRGCEYNPDGILSLGQILSSPFDPSNPLLPDSPIPMRDIEYSCQQSVNIGSSNSLGGSFGIWADINLLPISADVGGGAKVQKCRSWDFERLEGQIAVPRLDDICKILNGEDAMKHLRRSRFNFRKRLYIVTGVRIARGASLDVKGSKSTAAHGKLGLDLTMFGGPANAGPNGDLFKVKMAAYSFQHASDFVYAYRLNEIHYGKDISMKSYPKGETHTIHDTGQVAGRTTATNMEEEKEKHQEGEEYQIEIEGIEGSDFGGDSEAHQVFELSSEDAAEEYIVEAPGND